MTQFDFFDEETAFVCLSVNAYVRVCVCIQYIRRCLYIPVCVCVKPHLKKRNQLKMRVLDCEID